MGKSLDRQRDLNKVKFLKRKEHKAKKRIKYGFPVKTDKWRHMVGSEDIKEFAARLGIILE